MPDQRSIDDAGSVQKSIRERIESIKTRDKSLYFVILVTLYRRNGATLNELAQTLKSKPQNQHSRMERLIKLGVVRREKREESKNSKSLIIPEFYYYISPGIPKEEIEEIEKLVGDTPNLNPQQTLAKSNEPEQKTNNLDGVREVMETKSSKPSEADSPNQLSLKEKIQMRLSMLPEFDPTWPSTAQQAWFQAIKQLENMQ